MIKAVLDVNVILSGMIRPEGPPGLLLGRWDLGEFEIVWSPRLADELERVSAYPRIRERLEPSSFADFLAILQEVGIHCADVLELPPVRSEDPKDDYLIALALKAEALLVSGDHHLTDLRGRIPVFSPREFLEFLKTAE